MIKEMSKVDLSPIWNLYKKDQYFCIGFSELYRPGQGWQKGSFLYLGDAMLTDEDLSKLIIQAASQGFTMVNVSLIARRKSKRLNANPDYKISELLRQ